MADRAAAGTDRPMNRRRSHVTCSVEARAANSPGHHRTVAGCFYTHADSRVPMGLVAGLMLARNGLNL
jgi:hypothetical protein